MKVYDGYLIDLDGTMYRGTEKIAAACTFVQRLQQENIPYLFVTNNSSQTPEQVATKLQTFDIPATEDQVFTSSLATANYLSERKTKASVFAIGERGLFKALQTKGFVFVEESPDFVVVGIDKELTYEKLTTACLCVRAGADLIATNGDLAIPTERGMIPGNGSIIAAISASTQTIPTFIGKPEPILMEQALKKLGVPKEKTLMIGDNYDTDIMAGIQAGIDTLLVHTGVTSKTVLMEKKIQPTYSLDSLSDLWPLAHN